MTELRRILLKNSTRELHQKVESLLDLTAVFKSTQIFVEYLSAHLNILKSAKNFLGAVPFEESLLEFELSDRVNALEKDLSHLKSTSLRNSDLSSFTWPSLSEKSFRSFRWGFLYVIEGSAFGAGILRKMALAEGISESALNYFEFNMSLKRERWIRFIESLEAAQDIDNDSVLNGANAAFKKFEQEFESIKFHREKEFKTKS